MGKEKKTEKGNLGGFCGEEGKRIEGRRGEIKYKQEVQETK